MEVVSATLWSLYYRGRNTVRVVQKVGWAPRAGLDGRGKSRPPTGIQSQNRPASSESLYRLSYRGPRLTQG